MMPNTEQFKRGLRWYCVRSKPKKERMAASALTQLFELETFCPQVRFQRKTVRGSCWFQEAMFPGYFFARFDLFEKKQAVSYAPGVLNIPLFDGKIIPLPDDMMLEFKEYLAGGEVATAAAPLEAGDETTILEGAMRGLKVKVIRLLPAQDRVAVLMSLMGTLVEAEFPVDALEHQMEHPLAATG